MAYSEPAVFFALAREAFFFVVAVAVFFGALLAAAFILGSVSSADALVATAAVTYEGEAAVLVARLKRLFPRSGAAASSSRHSACVSVWGSRSFGTFAFFTRSVT